MPQADGVRDQPNNVITGKFTSASSEDIAVLCSAQGVSKIVVFRGGANADAIRTYHKEFGGASSLPSVVDHDGIEDITVDKASGIHYWFRGKWWHLAGMD